MNTRKIYQINLQPLSPITQMPDAQAIFGAFCYKYLEIYGEERLEQFIEKEKVNKEVSFSSLYYKDSLPMPLDFQPKRINDDVNTIKKQKNVKKIKYIDKSLYKKYRENKENFENNFYNLLNEENGYIIQNECLLPNKIDNNFTYLKHELRVRTKVQSGEEDSQLFYTNIYCCHEKAIFSFYISVSEKLEKEIIDVLKEFNYVTIGGHKSLGYNLFSVIDISLEPSLLFDKQKMLISKSICEKNIDYINSKYKLTIINNKFNNSTDMIYRSSLVCLVEGSIIDDSFTNIGELIVENNDNRKTCQYYIGMLI